jgi:hypothetical protein
LRTGDASPLRAPTGIEWQMRPLAYPAGRTPGGPATRKAEGRYRGGTAGSSSACAHHRRRPSRPNISEGPGCLFGPIAGTRLTLQPLECLECLG